MLQLNSIIYTYLQWPPRRKKPALLKAPTDVVEDVDAVAVTVTTTTVTTAITTIIMTTATIVDVTVDAIKVFLSIAAMCLIW